MRKLILQIRYTIFSRSLCVRHLQTILPYSPYLHGIFTIYSNFTPHTRIYFCKAESFFAELELTFSIHRFFCHTRFHHVFFLVKPFLLKKFTLFGGNHHLWREPSVAFHCFKIRVPPNRRIAFTLNSSFLSKSVNRHRISRHMRLYTEDIDNIVRCPFVPPRTRVRVEAKRIPNMSYNEI